MDASDVLFTEDAAPNGAGDFLFFYYKYAAPMALKIHP
jgi:hypothetical protein